MVILSAFYPPETGTSPKYVLDIAEGLAAAGHHVSVFTTRPRGYMLAQATAPAAGTTTSNLAVHRVWSHRSRRASVKGRLLEWATASLTLPVRARLRARPDVVLAWSPPLPLAYAATRLWRGAKRIVNLQDIYPKTLLDVGLLSPGFVARRLERMEQATYRRADVVVVDSAVNKRHVVERGAKRVEVVESWASTAGSAAPGSPGPGFRAGAQVLASYAGMFSPHQGLDVIVDAAKHLAAKPGLRIVLAGGGMERDRLAGRAKAAPNLHLAPYLKETDYLALLGDTDIGLVTLAAKVETAVPGKVYSLMAAGVPIIASVPLNGPVPEVLSRSGAGIAVAAGDSVALAEAIQELADDPGRRARLGAAGLAYAHTRATKANAIRQYHLLIEEICTRRAS